MTNNEITIPYSKRKLYTSLILFISTSCLCVWGLSIADRQTSVDPFSIKSFCVIWIIFSVPISFYYINRLFIAKRPGFVINSEGIIDNSSMLGAQSFKWSNIIRFGTTSAMTASIVLVFVNDPDVVTKNDNYLRPFFRASNTKTYGTPFLISSGALDCSFNDLNRLLLEGFEKYKT